MGFDVLSIVQMIGGLALFIYGMTTMGKVWSAQQALNWRKHSKK